MTPHKLLEVQALPVALGESASFEKRRPSQESFGDHWGLHRTYMTGSSAASTTSQSKRPSGLRAVLPSRRPSCFWSRKSRLRVRRRRHRFSGWARILDNDAAGVEKAAPSRLAREKAFGREVISRKQATSGTLRHARRNHQNRFAPMRFFHVSSTGASERNVCYAVENTEFKTCGYRHLKSAKISPRESICFILIEIPWQPHRTRIAQWALTPTTKN